MAFGKQLYFAGSNAYFTGYLGVNMGSQPSKPFQVNGTIQVDLGSVYVSQGGNGVILKIGGGSCWLLYASATGTAVTTSYTCP